MPPIAAHGSKPSSSVRCRLARPPHGPRAPNGITLTPSSRVYP